MVLKCTFEVLRSDLMLVVKNNVLNVHYYVSKYIHKFMHSWIDFEKVKSSKQKYTTTHRTSLQNYTLNFGLYIQKCSDTLKDLHCTGQADNIEIVKWRNN